MNRFVTGILILPLLALFCIPGAVLAGDPGYMGILLGPVPEALADQLGSSDGAIVEEVLAGSPAEKAGLVRHDVVTAANGDAVKGPDDLRKKVRSMKAGETLRLELKRSKESLQLAVVLGSPPGARSPQVLPLPEKKDPTPEAEPEPREAGAKKAFLGVGFGDVPPIVSSHLGLGEGAGVVVGDVWKGSPAEKAGIEKNDVLVAIDAYEIKGAQDFSRLMGEKKPGDKVKVERFHKGAKSTLEVELAARPADLPRASEDSFWPPHDGRFHPFDNRFPRMWRKGRVVIEAPEGKSYSFDIPDQVWEAEKWAKDFNEQMKVFNDKMGLELKKLHGLIDPDALSRRLKKLTDDLDQIRIEVDIPDDTVQSRPAQSAVLRLVEGDLDLTLRDDDGRRTVTVKKGDKVIAQDLPYDKIDTLPADVRERVEKAAKDLRVNPTRRPLEVLPTGKIRA